MPPPQVPSMFCVILRTTRSTKASLLVRYGSFPLVSVLQHRQPRAFHLAKASSKMQRASAPNSVREKLCCGVAGCCAINCSKLFQMLKHQVVWTQPNESECKGITSCANQRTINSSKIPLSNLSVCPSQVVLRRLQRIKQRHGQGSPGLGLSKFPLG